MDFQEFKSNLQGSVRPTTIFYFTNNDNSQFFAVSSLDNLTSVIEKCEDCTVVRIGDCETFDYNFKGEINLTIDRNDNEESEIRYCVSVVSLY